MWLPENVTRRFRILDTCPHLAPTAPTWSPSAPSPCRPKRQKVAWRSGRSDHPSFGQHTDARRRPSRPSQGVLARSKVKIHATPMLRRTGAKMHRTAWRQRGFFRRQEIGGAFGVVVGDHAAGVIMWKVELGETHIGRVTPQVLGCRPVANVPTRGPNRPLSPSNAIKRAATGRVDDVCSSRYRLSSPRAAERCAKFRYRTPPSSQMAALRKQRRCMLIWSTRPRSARGRGRYRSTPA